MTGMQLFESLQYLDDTLLTEGQRAAAHPKPRLRWIAAACLVLAVGVAAALHGQKPVGKSVTDLGTVSPVQGTGEKGMKPIQPGGVPGLDPQPVGVPGPGALPGGEPGPAVLEWNDLDAAERFDAGLAQGGVIMVADPLTEAELSDCCPEIRLEWMGNAEGYAAYYLVDGSGGLAFAELRFTNPAWDGTTTVRIRDTSAPKQPDPPFIRWDSDTVGVLNRQEYRAYRCFYDDADAVPRVDLMVIFRKENVEYTMVSDFPRDAQAAAEQDMTDLLLAYAGTHRVPELSAFRFSGDTRAVPLP